MAASPVDGMYEEWRPVRGYEGLYEVSALGRVRSLPREVIGKTKRGEPCVRRRKGKELKPDGWGTGHQKVTLYGAQGVDRQLIHRLALEAFVGPCPPGMEGCHWDDNPSNNTLGNLRWASRSENKMDSVRNGIHHQARKTHCPQGHELTPEPWRPNRRWCEACVRKSKREYQQRQAGVKT